MYISIYVFGHSFWCSQQLKMLESKISHEKKKCTHEILTKKKFGPTKYLQKEIWPTKYPRENFFNSRNIHEKKIWTHEIPTRKNFGPTKYPHKKILDPRNTHEKKFRALETLTKARWHDDTRSMRPTMARNPWNLAHSLFSS